MKHIRKTKKQFIIDAVAIHGDRYNYDDVLYLRNNFKVKIICKLHGIFEQTPLKHISSKRGCPECNGGIKLTTNKFIERAQKIHGTKFSYINSTYKNSHSKIEIICIKHGSFLQTATDHLSKKGCPQCNQSKGENEIEKYLKLRNIEFEKQKRFDGCRNVRPLPFDFYLPTYNVLIEYDGEHHFKKTIYSNDLESIKINDQIKTNFAIDENYKLIRISYKNLNKIQNILSEI